MVRNNLTFILILLSCLVNAQQLESISTKFNDILLNLEDKITNTEPGNEYVVRSFNFTLEKIRQGEVSAVFDDKLNYGITGCASANILEDGSINFSFGKFLIDAYEAFPILVEGIIVHEFQHVYDFATKPRLIEISRSNPIEKSYFEVDGITIEGIYFNSYRTKSDNISRLENFFLAEINSGFWSVIAIFDRVDLQLLHQIDDVEKNTETKEEAIQNFINIGRELLDRVEFNDNNWNNYCNLVSLRTFSFYSRQVVFDILFVTEGKELTDDELKLSDFPEIDSTVSEALALIDKYESFFIDFRRQVINSYNEEVISAIR